MQKTSPFMSSRRGASARLTVAQAAAPRLTEVKRDAINLP